MLSSIGPERWRRLAPLLDEALELDEERRASYLDSTCAGEPELRADLERLLGSCDAAESFLERPAADLYGGLLVEPEPAVAGTRIGPYRILAEAGRGGMATVYVAERADGAYQKRVALKLVRAGPALDAHLARRFREERQILAALDHSHVARLLDGGLTPEGTPWFALEYVEGTPLDRYADARRLPVDERLRLFLQVCEAVQYAHRNLVVHRDLKPSNILVTGAGDVKLLDFGIAKVLAAGEAGAGLTQSGLRPMTPEYASPEQVRGEPVAVSTDVHALGVVLYELLTGKHPFRRAGRPLRELERAILEELPEPPSMAAAQAGPEVASARGTTPERLRRRLRGDLDTIVLTALRKEPARRYPDVERMASDLRRERDGLPVSARPDTWRYRAGKFVRRHAAGIAAAAAFVGLLAGFAALMALQSARTARERDKAERVSGFLVDLLTANPYEGRGADLTVREVLDSAAVRVDRELADQPELRANLLGIMGRSFRELALYERSQPLLETAIGVRMRTGGDLHELADDQLVASRNAFQLGDFAAAESLARSTLATERRIHGERDPGVLRSLSWLANVLRHAGRWTEAEGLFREALALQRAHGDTGPHSPSFLLLYYGGLLRDRGDFAGAESLYREEIAKVKKTFGPGHVHVAELEIELARILHEKGDPSAEQLMRRALETERRALGDDHPEIAVDGTYLAPILADRGELAAAESLYRRGLDAMRRASPSGDISIALALSGLGRVLLRRSDPRAAEPVLREAVAMLQKPGKISHWRLAEYQRLLGTALTMQGRYAEAEPLLRESFRRLSSTAGAEHAQTLEARRALAELYESWGKPDKAKAYRDMPEG